MLEVTSMNGTAKIFTDVVEDAAYKQVKTIMDHDVSKGAQVRLMPDIHFGKGATVGTSIQLPKERNDWRVSPNVVGVDIGCGMLSYKLAVKNKFDYAMLKQLDDTIKTYVPAGFKVHKRVDKDTRHQVKDLLSRLKVALTGKQHDHITHSLGTLGGGNHFIELAQDEEGAYWLTVHSGSRNLGVQVAAYHQSVADNMSNVEDVEVGLGYLAKDALDDYLNDMSIAQQFAALNRKSMLNHIVEHLPYSVQVMDSFDSVHNFISIDEGIIRKGATSARLGERLIVPLNMKEGSLICEGLGNYDWNNSAPHGAGRQMSRTAAKREIPMKMFKRDMEGVYSTSVKTTTLDEAPAAYKPSKDVIDYSKDTMKIIHQLTPLMNFKA